MSYLKVIQNIQLEGGFCDALMQMVQTLGALPAVFPIARLSVPFARDQLPASITEHGTC
jgi:hypothetical protein